MSLERPRPGIGHNNPPEPGLAWRKHCWTKARADLLPTLPIEILKVRVRRAKALGLPYQTYASIRASTGRDVIGFLFSQNGLRVDRRTQTLPRPSRAGVERITGADRVLLTHPDFDGGALVAASALDAWAHGPAPDDPYAVIRASLRETLKARRLPADGVLMIGTPMEHGWTDIAGLARHIDSETFFGGATP